MAGVSPTNEPENNPVAPVPALTAEGAALELQEEEPNQEVETEPPEVIPELEPEPVPAPEQEAIWLLLSDAEIDALTPTEIYGWLERLERDYGVRPPRGYDLVGEDELRSHIREAVRSDRVRVGYERRQQQEEGRAADAGQRARLAFPEIREHVEVPVHGDVRLRIVPFPGGYAVVAVVGRDQIYRHSAKTPPWRSDKIIADTTAGAAEAIARRGHGAEADARGWVSAAWQEIRNQVREDPDAELALMSPNVKRALERLIAVRILRGESTITEVVYEVGGDEPNVTLTFDSKAYTGPVANLNEKWYNHFAPDELAATKEDWPEIKRYWRAAATITHVEQCSVWDGIIDQFRTHLMSVRYGRSVDDLIHAGTAWHDDANGVVWYPASIVQEFLDRLIGGDLKNPNTMARELRGRGIMLQATKPLQRTDGGVKKQRRAWPIDPNFVDYQDAWSDDGGLV